MAKKKKQLTTFGYLVITAVILMIAIISVLFYHNIQKSAAYQSTYDSLTMTVNEDALNVEYGSTFDGNQIIQSSSVDPVSSTSIDTYQIGEQNITYLLSTKDSYDRSVEREYTYTIHVVDTNAPVIELVEDAVTVVVGQTYDPISNISRVSDVVDGELSYAENGGNGTYYVEGNVDTSLSGTYTCTIHATDKNGVQSTKSFDVYVSEMLYTDYPYYISVNRAANTVTIYLMDSNGQYTIPYMAMVCSTGEATPVGVYQVESKIEGFHPLFGNVYGQYAQRIVGNILFHSVPYYSPNHDDLEYEEYNKLGTAASMGCIRLCVRDVKWIYDNCPIGTIVEIYDDVNNPGPLGKPDSIQIDTTNEAIRGWDPTDPNENNPYLQ